MINQDACWSHFDKIVALDEELSGSKHGKQTRRTSHWKKEERNWPCCSDKVFGLRDAHAPGQNSEHMDRYR